MHDAKHNLTRSNEMGIVFILGIIPLASIRNYKKVIKNKSNHNLKLWDPTLPHAMVS